MVGQIAILLLYHDYQDEISSVIDTTVLSVFQKFSVERYYFKNNF